MIATAMVRLKTNLALGLAVLCSLPIMMFLVAGFAVAQSNEPAPETFRLAAGFPRENAQNMSTSVAINLRFNQAVAPDSLKFLRLFAADGTEMPCRKSTDLTNASITLVPQDDLQPLTEYTCRGSEDVLSNDGQPVNVTGLRAAGGKLAFSGPLDITQDKRTGILYIADFGTQSKFGADGSLKLLRPSRLVGKAESITIALIGDSTVEEQSGWGVPFRQRFTDDVKVLNFAKGGASSKSWYDGNRMPTVLAAKPDYVLIQFGHNDQPGKGPARETDPETTYRENLRRYVADVDSIGAQPIIVSSVTRRRFDADNKIRTTLTPWARAAESVASELKVPFIDLHQLSIQLHNQIGPEASMKFNYKEGDLTHFNKTGGAVMADLVIKELKSAVPALTRFLRNQSQQQQIP